MTELQHAQLKMIAYDAKLYTISREWDENIYLSVQLSEELKNITLQKNPIISYESPLTRTLIQDIDEIQFTIWVCSNKYAEINAKLNLINVNVIQLKTRAKVVQVLHDKIPTDILGIITSLI